MKKYWKLLGCLLAAMLIFSCTEKTLPDQPEQPGTEETPGTEDTPGEEEETPGEEEEEPTPEPEKVIKPLLDFAFNADGTAYDASGNNYTIQTIAGTPLLTWDNAAYDGKMARFCHSPGATITEGYYKFDYSADTDFIQKMSDGYSLEAILMLDFTPDGAAEIKAFGSTVVGGTAFIVAASNQGKELTFLTNVSINGQSNWIWGKTGVVPERGKYYHIIGVWDKENKEARVYLDGELKKTVKTNGSYNFPRTKDFYWFCVGADPGDKGSITNGWRGDVAMARIYDEALTTEWVTEHYNNLAINIPTATYQPKDIVYKSPSSIQAGGKFIISGTGIKDTDILKIESLDGTYKADCVLTAVSTSMSAKLPNDITKGTYKLALSRDNEIYPIGTAVFTIGEVTAPLAGPKVIAHRGYHKDGIPENSLEGFKKAIDYKYYGSELDVHVTTDGRIVCCHDATIGGMNVENSTYEQVKDIKLSNGESLPTLEAILAELKKSKDTKLILEIKTHNSVAKSERCVDVAMAMIEEAGLKDMVEYIAFDYNVCKRIVSKDPNAMVGYLNGDKAPSVVLADGIKCIDYASTNLAVSPAWLKEAKEIGVIVNVWTVNSTNDLVKWIEKGVDYITTDNPDILQTLVELYCN